MTLAEPTPQKPGKASKPTQASEKIEATEVLSTSSIIIHDKHETNDDERVPQLHAKTYLALFTVCLIYFAQLVNLVGAGAVSDSLVPTTNQPLFAS